MVECFKCGKSDEEIKIFDGISSGEIVKVCEACADNEEMPLIRKPTTAQLKESEKKYTVKERLRRMAGLTQEKEEIKRLAKKITDVTLDDLWRKKKQKEREEKIQAGIAKPLALIDNFHWHVFMARRKRKLTKKQLAQEIGESEAAIKMIESRELPEDALILINKLEQFLNIKLKKRQPVEEVKSLSEEKKAREKREAREKKLDTSKSKDFDSARKSMISDIPEKIDIKLEEAEEKKKEPIRVLKFGPEAAKRITIADLKEMKERRELKKELERQKRLKADELIKRIEKEIKEKEEKMWGEESEKSLLGEDLELD